MSLVGTRPILPDELEQYELHHRARIAIKPGITGMWQVSGRSDITDFEEIVRLDTEYISEWNILLHITMFEIIHYNLILGRINNLILRNTPGSDPIKIGKITVVGIFKHGTPP